VTEYDDIVIDSEPTIKASMPYLSGPVLCDLCTLFGLPMTYSWNGGSLSRWMYMEMLLEHCMDRDSALNYWFIFLIRDNFNLCYLVIQVKLLILHIQR